MERSIQAFWIRRLTPANNSPNHLSLLETIQELFALQIRETDRDCC